MSRFTRSPLPQACAIIAVLFATRISFLCYGPKLLINFTDSTPKGVYQLAPLTHPLLDQFVALPPPEKAIRIASGRPWFRQNRLFIKKVAAVAGDIVCISAHKLRLNGAIRGPVFEVDKQGRPLPHFQGCYVMGPDEVFLLGPDSPWTFDSRYFGPVSASLIPYSATHLLALPL